MIHLAESLCHTFSRTLIQEFHYVSHHGKWAHLHPKLNTTLIFLALERCKRDSARLAGVDLPDDEMWCRFTLGKIEKAELKYLANLFADMRDVNPKLLETPKVLSEFLFDFSISSLAIDEAYATKGDEPKYKFQMLLVAESELASSDDKVTEDLLRLVVAKSPVKALVFHDRGYDLTKVFEKIMKRCAPVDHYKDSHWFFFGVPKYNDWRKARARGKQAGGQVYYLPLDSDQLAIQNQPTWWAG